MRAQLSLVRRTPTSKYVMEVLETGLGHLPSQVTGSFRLVDEPFDTLVGLFDVFWISRKCYPTAAAPSLHKRGDECTLAQTFKFKGVVIASKLGLPTQIVSVVKDVCAGFLHLHHGFTMVCHGGLSTFDIDLWIVSTQSIRFFKRQSAWHITVEWVVRRGLICDEVKLITAGNDLGKELGSITEETDRDCFLFAFVYRPAEALRLESMRLHRGISFRVVVESGAGRFRY